MSANIVMLAVKKFYIFLPKKENFTVPIEYIYESDSKLYSQHIFCHCLHDFKHFFLL